jgi:excisionase family DNA binding protein
VTDRVAHRALPVSGSTGDSSERFATPLSERLALRPAEAARALGVSERTLRTLLPRLPHVRLSGTVLLPVRDLERWLHEQARAEVESRRQRVTSIVHEGIEALTHPRERRLGPRRP